MLKLNNRYRLNYLYSHTAKEWKPSLGMDPTCKQTATWHVFKARLVFQYLRYHWPSATHHHQLLHYQHHLCHLIHRGNPRYHTSAAGHWLADRLLLPAAAAARKRDTAVTSSASRDFCRGKVQQLARRHLLSWRLHLTTSTKCKQNWWQIGTEFKSTACAWAFGPKGWSVYWPCWGTSKCGTTVVKLPPTCDGTDGQTDTRLMHCTYCYRCSQYNNWRNLNKTPITYIVRVFIYDDINTLV